MLGEPPHAALVYRQRDGRFAAHQEGKLLAIVKNEGAYPGWAEVTVRAIFGCHREQIVYEVHAGIYAGTGPPCQRESLLMRALSRYAPIEGMRHERLLRWIDHTKRERSHSSGRRYTDRAISLAVTNKPDFIRMLRNGKGGEPSATQIARLAQVLGVPTPAADLIGGEGHAASSIAGADMDTTHFMLALRAADRQMRLERYTGPNREDHHAKLAARIYKSLRQHAAEGHLPDEEAGLRFIDALFQGLDSSE
jgi:hypothetical protein